MRLLSANRDDVALALALARRRGSDSRAERLLVALVGMLAGSRDAPLGAGELTAT
jgi:hypothetical protein